jgi:replicative DNA helicase
MNPYLTDHHRQELHQLPPDRKDQTVTRPHALPSETSLLGTVLAYPPTAALVLSDLEPPDLHDPRNGAVLDAIQWLISEGTAPELPIVLAFLHRNAGVRPPSGSNWALILTDLLHVASTPTMAPAYRRAVLEARLRRDALTFAERLHDVARNGDLGAVWTALDESTTALGRTLARISETTSHGDQAEEVAA